MRSVTGREQPIQANGIIQRQRGCLRGPGDMQAAPKPQGDPAAPGCPSLPPPLSWGQPQGTRPSLTFLCFLAIHLSQLLSMSSHLDSRCRSTSKGTSSSLRDGGRQEAGQRGAEPSSHRRAPPVPSSTLRAPHGWLPAPPPPHQHRAWLGHARERRRFGSCRKRSPPVKSPRRRSPNSPTVQNLWGAACTAPTGCPSIPGDLCAERRARQEGEEPGSAARAIS